MNNCKQHRPLESARKSISRRDPVQKGNEATMVARFKQRTNGWSVMETTGIVPIPMMLLVIARATIRGIVDPVATSNDTVSHEFMLSSSRNVLYDATRTVLFTTFKISLYVIIRVAVPPTITSQPPRTTSGSVLPAPLHESLSKVALTRLW
jgi:hypothetical protein